MKKCNNILCCIAVMLFLTCFIFNLTVTSKTTLSAKASEKIENSTPIPVQQREIKNGLKRIEKKLQRRRKR
tara:strand:- start:1127 stop:1339 length:213 start_codon:yes stop_codon:yes gene_type:complete